jgi:alkanesulfonate monooxygenase SsuD/methylene tetrahydromethanopterin reductase-like flavin-dependent oxidoreductase (luciferase family)
VWLDEAADAVTAAWSGAPVQRAGRYITVDDVTFLPTPLQQPRIPLWFAARGDAAAPVRRAARYDGLFAIEVDVDQLGRMLDVAQEIRGDLDGFDVAVLAPPVSDAAVADVPGVTWLMHSTEPGEPFADVLAWANEGPPR